MAGTVPEYMIGETYGELTVLSKNKEYGNGKSKGRYVNCTCSCGEDKIIRYDSLLRGDTKSCGCSRGITCGVKFKVKRSTDHPLYQVWTDMNRRCLSPARKDYKHYGGRGITVCSDWSRENKNGFKNFLSDMESSFEEGLELEREDTNKGYVVTNCLWVNRRSQVNNTRVNNNLTYKGLTLSIAEWSYLLEINPKELQDRVGKLNNDIAGVMKKGFNTKSYKLLYKGEVCTLKQVRELESINYSTQRKSRIENGGTVEGLKALGVDVEELTCRSKGILDMETSLKRLEIKTDKSCFDTNLLYKINKQLEGL